MALTRAAKIIGVTRGTGPAVTIDGVTGFDMSIEAIVKESASDGVFGPTAMDVTKWEVSGWIEVDDIMSWETLEDLAAAQLAVTYRTMGGANKTLTIAATTGVVFEDFSEIVYDSGEVSGPTTRYRVNWRALWDASWTALTQMLTFA